MPADAPTLRLLLPALLALGACGLDDFSFGGPKDPCGVEWTMSFHDMGELDRVRPRLSQVREHPDGIAWIASYRLAGESVRLRFRIAGARLDVIDSNFPPMSGVGTSHCVYDERESELRVEPLARHTCSVEFVGIDEAPRPPRVPGEPATAPPWFVLEEIDQCSGA